MPKAVLGDTVIAEAEASEVVRIEGNVYFPPSSVKRELLTPSPTPYTCAWKGECQYFSVLDGDEVLRDRAWSYPAPYASATDRVGADFAHYVAFWKDVRVTD